MPSNDFDPAAFVAAHDSPVGDGDTGAFNPGAFVAAHQDVGEGEAALRGLAQGATMGFADEATGAAQAGIDKFFNPLENTKKDFGDLYRQHRDESRAAYDAAQKQHPWAYGAGELGGAAATAAIPGLGEMNLGKAALLGGLAGAGTSKADLTSGDTGQLADFGKDVGVGAAIGGVAQGALGLAGKGVDAFAPDALRKFAGNKAFKAAGAAKRDFLEAGDNASTIGQQLLKQGIVKPGSSLEDIAAAASDAKAAAGQKIGDSLGAVDDLVAKTRAGVASGDIGGDLPSNQALAFQKQLSDNYQFNSSRIADRIRNELIAPNQFNPNLSAERAQLERLAQEYESNPNLTLKMGNEIKGTQGMKTNFASESVPQAFKQQVYGIINSELEGAVGRTENLQQALAKNSGKFIGDADPEAGKTISQALSDYKNAKQTYGAMKTVTDMTQNRLAATNANRMVSPTDYGAMIIGAASGHGAAAIPLGIANKIARKYGNSILAAGANGLANILEKDPVMLGRFSAPILNAARRGNSSLAATHFVLSQTSPEYQRLLGEDD